MEPPEPRQNRQKQRKLEWLRVNVLRQEPRPQAARAQPQAQRPVLARPNRDALRPLAPGDLAAALGGGAARMPDVGSKGIGGGYTRPRASGPGLAGKFLDAVAGGKAAEARQSVFDATDTRRDIPEGKRAQIDRMRKTGAAAAVEIRAADGHTLKGNFISARGANLKDSGGQPDTRKPVVLLLTGSGGPAEEQGLDMATFYRESGASCLSVNYRGFGESEDVEMSEQGFVEDAQDMLEYLLKLGYRSDQIVLHGYSMGGAVAALLEKNNTKQNPDMKFRGAVHDRPMTSTQEAAEASLVADGEHRVAASLQGKAAEWATGFKDTRKAILDGDRELPRVLTTDTSEHVGEPGQRMRGKLDGKLGDLGGVATGSGHFDHGAMLRSNEQHLLNVLHPGAQTAGDVMPDEEDAYDGLTKLLQDLDTWATTVENYTNKTVAGVQENVLNHWVRQVQQSSLMQLSEGTLAGYDAIPLSDVKPQDASGGTVGDRVRRNRAGLEDFLRQVHAELAERRVMPLRNAIQQDPNDTATINDVLDSLGEDHGLTFFLRWDEVTARKGDARAASVAQLREAAQKFKDPTVRSLMQELVETRVRTLEAS